MHQDQRVIKEQVVVGSLLLGLIILRKELILQHRLVVVVPMLGTITKLLVTSPISMIGHLRVFSLILVGVVFSSLVHLEFNGDLMESVSLVDNMDTSHLIALKGNHHPQAKDPQHQNLQLVIWVEPRECTQWSLILLQGERVQWDPHSEFLAVLFL